MSLFNAVFGGSKSRSAPSTVWGGQAPFLTGLYGRAWDASLGGAIPGFGIPGFGMPPGGGMGGGMPVPDFTGQGSLSGGKGGVLPGALSTIAGGLFGGGGRMGGAGGGAGAGFLPGVARGDYTTGKRPTPLPMPARGAQDPLGLLGGQLLTGGMGMAGNLAMMGQAGNPFAQAQIGQLGRELGSIWERNIMPGIASQFSLAGGLGGDRQALALGEAAGRLGEQFRGGATDILGRSAELALGANQAGLGSLGGLFGLGNAALFGSLPGLSSLIGGPTVLGGGSRSKDYGGGVMGSVSNLIGAIL